MKDAILWLVLAAIWGTSYLAIKVGVESISPLMLVAVRMSIGSIVMLFIISFSPLRLPRDLRSWSVMLIAGLSGNIVPFALIGYGEIHVESGLAALIMGIAPVITVLLAPFVHQGERLNSRMIIGVVAGLLGLALLFGPSAVYGLGGHALGQMAIFAAALCYAFTTLFSRRFADLPAMVMAAGSMLGGTVVIYVAAIIQEEPSSIAAASQSSIFAAIYLGLFPTAVATLIYFHLVHRIGAGRLSQINFAVPLVGALLGAVVLDETLQTNAYVALAMILTAIYLTTRPAKQRR